MNHQSGIKKSRASRLPIAWVVLFLVLLNLLVIGYAGCVSARDSGSTVTGRSMSFPGSHPVAFMRVLLKGESATRMQVTDSTGSVTMYHVPKGDYIVTWAFQGVSVYQQDLVIEQSGQIYVADIPGVDQGTSALSGTVTDITGKPKLPGANVWIDYQGKGLAHTMAGVGGRYNFGTIPDGDTKVIAVAPGYQKQIFDNVRIGFEGVKILDIGLTPTPKPAATGRILGKVTGEDGLILSDAYVGALKSDVPANLYTDAEQEELTTISGYELTLPVGTYTIIYTKSGFALKTEKVEVEANVDKTVNVSLVSEETLWRQSTVTK